MTSEIIDIIEQRRQQKNNNTEDIKNTNTMKRKIKAINEKFLDERCKEVEELHRQFHKEFLLRVT